MSTDTKDLKEVITDILVDNDCMHLCEEDDLYDVRDALVERLSQTFAFTLLPKTD